MCNELVWHAARNATGTGRKEGILTEKVAGNAMKLPGIRARASSEPGTKPDRKLILQAAGSPPTRPLHARNSVSVLEGTRGTLTGCTQHVDSGEFGLRNGMLRLCPEHSAGIHEE